MPIFSWILCLKYYLKSCFGLFTKTRNFKKNSEITQCTMHMVNRHLFFYTVCPNKHWNWVTNSRSSLLRISIVIPDLKDIILLCLLRVYLMKTVNGCKDVFIMSSQDEQGRRKSLPCLCTAIILFYNRMYIPYAVKHKQNVNITDETLTD